ncbi:hypothetical protein [Streptomyces sp. URMC 129]|uniref:hypothetical protein n=1 Tax=Streptomyces sp. URMC 129 TaxID=3423407 RepID=UPI003F1C04D6
MNRIELRTIIHNALNTKVGTEYGDILSVERLDPFRQEWGLRVTAPDPMGEPRVFRVIITEG